MERFTDGKSENYSNIYLAISSIDYQNSLKISRLVAKYQRTPEKYLGLSGAN